MNDWQTENDPLVLLGELYPLRTLGSTRTQTRKCRRYLLECARRQWHRLPGVCRALVALAEVYAESPREKEWLRAECAPIAEQLINSDAEESGEWRSLRAMGLELMLAGRGPASVDLRRTVREACESADSSQPPLTEAEWRGLAALVYLPFILTTPPFGWVPRDLHAADLVREIHYNPHRFVPFDPAWRTTDVLALARGMYDSREFGAMPILADALQDAGCGGDDILDHCRDPKQIHVRGCWVLDLALDRG